MKTPKMLTLLTLAMAFFGPGSPLQAEDAVVAKIGDREVTAAEIRQTKGPTPECRTNWVERLPLRRRSACRGQLDSSTAQRRALRFCAGPAARQPPVS